MRRLLPLLVLLPLALLPGESLAQGFELPGLKVDVSGDADAEDVSTAFQVLALLTVLSLAPAILEQPRQPPTQAA